MERGGGRGYATFAFHKQKELFQKFPQVADKIWCGSRTWRADERRTVEWSRNMPVVVVVVCLCLLCREFWERVLYRLFAHNTHTHTHRERGGERERDTRTGKHAHVTSPFAGHSYAYASSAAGTFNKHINIIKLHAINAICTGGGATPPPPCSTFNKLDENNFQANCFCHWLWPEGQRVWGAVRQINALCVIKNSRQATLSCYNDFRYPLPSPSSVPLCSQN